MPYINESLREDIDPLLNKFIKGLSTRGIYNAKIRAGILNYIFSKILGDIINDETRYHCINEMIGVLECVKLELYRRIASPYEDQAIKQSGDIEEYWALFPRCSDD